MLAHGCNLSSTGRSLGGLRGFRETNTRGKPDDFGGDANDATALKLRAAGDWEVLAINEFDSDIYATPAVSESQMYIRTQNALYAIGSFN